jgi:hypothetical protein
VLVYPGQKSGWLVMRDVLKAAHDDARESITKEIERRQAAGVPVSDDVDMDLAREKLSRALEVTCADSLEDARKAAEEAAAYLSGVPRDPGEYEAAENTDRIRMQMIVMTDHDHRRLRFAVLDAARKNTGGEGGDLTPIIEGRKAFDEACAAFIFASVAALEVDGKELPVDAKTIAALSRSDGLLHSVYAAAQSFQGLPAKKLLPFVSSPA